MTFPVAMTGPDTTPPNACEPEPTDGSPPCTRCQRPTAQTRGVPHGSRPAPRRIVAHLSLACVAAWCSAPVRATPFIVPTPKHLAIAGETRLGPDVSICYSSDRVSNAAHVLADELNREFGWHCRTAAGGRGHIVVQQSDSRLPPGGYRIEAGTSSVVITGQDADGAFWGAMSLLQAIESTQTRFDSRTRQAVMPRLNVVDHPDNPWRGYMLQLAYRYDPLATRDVIRAMAKWKLNHVVLETGPKLELSFDSGMVRRPMVSKAEARALCAYARRYHVEPIPGLNSLGHLDRAYQHPRFTPHGGLDITREDTYTQFLFPIYEEYLEAFRPVTYFHAGMDESFALFKHLANSGHDVPRLFANHIRRVRNFLAARGVKLIVWSDMLLAAEQCGANHTGAINGGPPYNSYRALDWVPADVLIDYWVYSPLQEYPVIDFLRGKGFDVICSPWRTPRNLVQRGTARGCKLLGTSWTSFEYGGEHHFFAASDTAPVMPCFAEYAWNRNAPERTRLPWHGSEVVLHELCRRPTRVPPAGTPRSIQVQSGPASLAELGLPIHGGDQAFRGVAFSIDPKPLLVGQIPAAVDFTQVKLPLWACSPNKDPQTIDGIDRPRRDGELIVYRWGSGQSRTGTNIHGMEAAVVNGKVVATNPYGAPGMAIPPGGYVLSAHMSPNAGGMASYRWVADLRTGDSVYLVSPDGSSAWNYATPRLSVQLPDGARLDIDGVDKDRGADQLLLYRPSYGRTTGTNQWGAEVLVRNDTVTRVMRNAGNSPIPDGAYILSAHRGPKASKAKALSALKPGDRIRLLAFGASEVRLDATPARHAAVVPLSDKAGRMVILHASRGVAKRGTRIGQYVIVRRDGSRDTVALRYGVNISAAAGMQVSTDRTGTHWAAFTDTREQIVRGAYALEWLNPNRQMELAQLRIELTSEGSMTQLALLAVTLYD